MKHGPFKNKTTANSYAKRMRKKGFSASRYKSNGKWCVGVTRK